LGKIVVEVPRFRGSGRWQNINCQEPLDCDPEAILCGWLGLLVTVFHV
jgi:hypothetical protein